MALADAQSITVLRAIQKGNAPSLVAALACDTAAMYQTAAQAFNHFSISSRGSKAGSYAEWKMLVFQGYMYAFTGLSLQAPLHAAVLRAAFSVVAVSAHVVMGADIAGCSMLYCCCCRLIAVKIDVYAVQCSTVLAIHCQVLNGI